MPGLETIEKWRALTTSTEPVDRPTAEAAIREVYAAAAMPPPAHFLWYDSPLAAIWAVAALAEGTDHALDLSLPLVRQRSASRARHDEARSEVCERLGVADLASAQALAGTWLETRQHHDALAARIANARFGFLQDAAGDDWVTYMTRTDDSTVETIKADERNVFGQIDDGILGHGAAGTEAADIRHLLARSAHSRLYSEVGSFSEMARDEQLAEAAQVTPPPLLRACWDGAAATGMWWPFDNAVVIAERPTQVERSGDGPLRMEFRDGFVAEPYKAKPKARPAPAREAKIPALLRTELARDHDARIAFLRGQSGGDLPHFDRYLAGDHEGVWRDLVALGADVRSDTHLADALAVAYETMHRVEQNVRLLAERLTGIGYRFVDAGSGGGLFAAWFGRRGGRLHAPHVTRAPGTFEAIRELERTAGGPIPLSLRAFFDVVGAVDFTGEHDSLSPRNSPVTPDALVVCSAEEAIGWLEDTAEEDEPMIAIAPDALHKSNISGGDPYMIAVPAAAADAPLEEEPHEVTFVEYLRIAIGWGGFPGWEEADASLPEALAELRRGLIPF